MYYKNNLASKTIKRRKTRSITLGLAGSVLIGLGCVSLLGLLYTTIVIGGTVGVLGRSRLAQAGSDPFDE